MSEALGFSRNTLREAVAAALRCRERLVFGLLQDTAFLHAPHVDMNVSILELAEAGRYDQAAAVMSDYLVQSERIVLAVYARRVAAEGWTT